MDGNKIKNDTETILWTEIILSVFGAKTPFSNLSGLGWTGPKYCVLKLIHNLSSLNKGNQNRDGGCRIAYTREC